ncbi:two-component sensor histidine kinase [Bacillus thuringiensis]|uniref:HAMP domain-containing histidine kinase n=1 Tax=Bacillus thuringiensis TaxID=1428 RepID=UPI000BEDAE05|nr:HAMP domain-containing histidine kinase [Bacillus thuringiensis]PDX94719.1 two-component sensor histidine kinase [Bacillus thuringiensis]PER57483.1 two-component sensor histidine kinase [Bacillus thuringiensis]PFE94945.1 two-component sensor histidine kinase [Bacillus thuringiensis]PGN62549.1 two-component sensor histidine kinase [Bacillus thuringiensis]PGZ84666.1 two-component sensor histidine kinase [Bacillus thuringiensis]
MVNLLIGIIFILLCVIYMQYRMRKNSSKNLRYTYEKLESIVNDKTGETLLVMTDDLELQKLLVAINQLLDAKQKTNADHAKVEISMRKMLSNISHDLKTPLTVILGYTEMLNKDKTINKEEQQILLEKVHTKTLEVMELIHKFFDLAKLESGDKAIEMTKVNMNEVCREKILSFYDLVTTKGFQVHIDIPERNIYALGNVEVLGRVLNNLISNAITYGDDGKALGMTLRDDETSVYIDVWDKGKGIDESHIDKVFERMYTLEDSRNRLYQGSGLGLTITKRLVEGMDGKIHLSSKPYEKTIFTIVLTKMQF